MGTINATVHALPATIMDHSLTAFRALKIKLDAVLFFLFDTLLYSISLSGVDYWYIAQTWSALALL